MPPMSTEAGSGPSADAAPAAHKRRKPGPVVKALMVLTLAGFIAPFIAIAVQHFRGHATTGGSINVVVHNDGATVMTLACRDNCNKSARATLTPDAKAEVVVSANPAGSRYEVLDAAGAVVGCLPMTTALSGVVVQVSQAVSCPGTPIAPRSPAAS